MTGPGLRRAPLHIAVALAAFEVEKIKHELGLSSWWITVVAGERAYRKTWAPPLSPYELRFVEHYRRLYGGA